MHFEKKFIAIGCLSSIGDYFLIKILKYKIDVKNFMITSPKLAAIDGMPLVDSILISK